MELIKSNYALNVSAIAAKFKKKQFVVILI